MILVPMTVAVSDVAVQMGVASNDPTIKAALAMSYDVTPLPTYEGATEFTPSTEEQIIQTAGKSVYDNISIDPIPSDYVDTSDATAAGAEDICNGKTAYAQGQKIIGTAISGASVKTGTITGSGTTQLQIVCDFAPDMIYVIGDLQADPSLRGVVSITIIKDSELIFTADASTSSTAETMAYSAHGISGYNDTSAPHATYANGVLTIDTVNNTSSYRFNSGITYSYKLVGFGNGAADIDGGTFAYNNGDDLDGGTFDYADGGILDGGAFNWR